MTPAIAILGLTGAWHGGAAWQFLFRPERTLRRSTLERPVSVIAIELFRFLGALNAALAVFALLLMTLPQGSSWAALAGFALVNLSQFAIDLRAARRGLAHGPMFRTITWGDGFFFALNAVAAFHGWWNR